MKLRSKLLCQNLQVLLITVLLTVVLSLIFGYSYAKFLNIPVNGSACKANEILLKNDKVLYSAQPITDIELQSVLLSIKMKDNTITWHGQSYEMTQQTFADKQDTYQMIEFYTMKNMMRFYQIMLLFIVIVFTMIFVICIFLMQRKNRTQIMDPIIHLKQSAECLTAGDVDRPVYDEGYGEIRDLSIAIEQLRIQLKANVIQHEKSEDNRKFLMSSISHDLKTPVTAIRGYVEGVLDGVANTPQKQEHYLKKAVDKTVLMSHMIEDLLLYTKLDLNQIPFQLERIQINAFMVSAIEDTLLSYTKEEKTLSLEDQLHEPCYIMLDPQRFQRVVQNILDNARKHTTRQQGIVRVTLRQSGAGIIIAFCDNGEGIKKEDLQHVFERFYRGDSARKIEGSSGLGLAIASQMVHGMNGRIWAVSEEQKGTSIMVSFPRVHSKLQKSRD